MSDVFDVLGTDHEAVTQMLADLEGASAAAAAWPDPDGLSAVVRRLLIESAKHEAVEEQLLWPVVRDRVRDGGRLADDALSQETQVRDLLDRLETLLPTDPEFRKLIARLIPAAREHISYEESRVWPGLRQALSAAEADDLGQCVAAAKEIAPPRSQPRGSGSPVTNAAGPVVAAAERPDARANVLTVVLIG